MGKSDLSVSKEKKQQIQSAEHKHMGFHYYEFKIRKSSRYIQQNIDIWVGIILNLKLD